MIPKSWISGAFFAIFLIAIHFKTVNLQENKTQCELTIEQELKNMARNRGSLVSTLYRAFPTGCLICSTPSCDIANRTCVIKASILGRVPIYNNLLEFGLSGKYFPELATIYVHLNVRCYYEISIGIRGGFRVSISECYNTVTPCEMLDQFDVRFTRSDNQHCVYFGMAFSDPDRLHTAWTPNCNEVPSAFFNNSKYIKITNRTLCHFDLLGDAPEVEYLFIHQNESTIDAIPIIVPCNPGGFAVDPRRGRFVIGDSCNKMFGKAQGDDVGINFIIDKIYKNDENLLFPYAFNRSLENMKPMYINANGTFGSRVNLAPIKLANSLMGNKTRVRCRYEDLGPRMPSESSGETDETGTVEATGTLTGMSPATSTMEAGTGTSARTATTIRDLTSAMATESASVPEGAVAGGSTFSAFMLNENVYLYLIILKYVELI